jgi:hypothetical protein
MSDADGIENLPSIATVLADPSVSFWLKTSLRSALCRDPVDAANDSAVLAKLLERRCDDVLSAR